MAEEGHGGQQRIVDDGQQQVVLTLRGSAGMMAWLLVSLYVGLVAWVQGSAGLLMLMI